jgi:PBP1b-binding outer membrane lipoprotein LpoB
MTKSPLRRLICLPVLGLLSLALLFAGCGKGDSASSSSASPKPSATATPKPTGDLILAKEHLDRAMDELLNKNFRGAQDYLEPARGEVVAAASAAKDKQRTELESIATSLASIKGLVDAHDADAEKELRRTTARVDKLAH